jgi:hypothetical protein
MKSPSPATLLIRKSSPPPMLKVSDDKILAQNPNLVIPQRDLGFNDMMWR